MSSRLLAASLLLACGAERVATAWVDSLAAPQCLAPHPELPVVLKMHHLRGGAMMGDDVDLDEEDDEEQDDESTDAAGEDALQNPFLDGTGGAGLPGLPEGGPALQDLASTLNDPAALQEALKQLQDPAVQQQVRQMLEDPTFQQSMKQYMEQMTKDPQFEALKKQTEAMLQEEGFVENMQKAFADLAGAGLGGKGEEGGEDES